jgi:predicted permease
MQRLLADFLQDARIGVRLLGRTRGISAAAVVTLALAIGGNTAIFSVTNALLFRPLPVAQPHALVGVRAGGSQMSWPNYRDIRERTSVFSDVAAHRRFVAGLTSQSPPVRLWGEQTSRNYFGALGVAAPIGRTYRASDTRSDLVVLADHTWRAQFGADRSIVGRVITINGRTFEVIGVMPHGFRGVAPAGLRHDLWLPFDDAASNSLVHDRRATAFEVFGRLKPGITAAQAEAAVRLTSQHIRSEHSEISESFVGIEVVPLAGFGAFRGMASLIVPVVAFLGLMTIVGGLVLLIGCANIAGLLIGRASARRKEIAVRLALGADRRRLVRQLLTESLLLSILGGAAGVLLAIWLTGAVNPFLSRLPVPVEFDLRIDPRVLAYVIGLSMLTVFVFGLAPARRAAQFDLVSSLRGETAGSVVRQRLRSGLVVGQVAACSALLVWGGLFLRSLGQIANADPGFDPAGVLLARIEFENRTGDRPHGNRTLAELQQRINDSPSTESVGMSLVVPLSLENEKFDVSDAESHSVSRVFANRLTPGWFTTVRIPFLAGRDFTWADREGAPDVAIVNETLARQLWHGDALGQRLQVPAQRTVEVVGVVRDSAYRTLGEVAAPTVYLPLEQSSVGQMTLHVRTVDVASAIDTITREIHRLVPGVVVNVTPMTDVLSVAFLPTRVGAALTSAFGVVSLLLAATGIYGLVAFSVSQRTRELGIRKAVGATPSSLIRLVLVENLGLTVSGLVAGLAVGALGAALFRGFLSGVSPLDPFTLVVVSALVAGVALVTSALPAVRAARVKPIVALRDA